MKTTGKRPLILCFALTLVLWGGCSKAPEELALVEAYNTLVKAVRTRDANSLFDVSDASLAQKLDDLLVRLQSARRVIDARELELEAEPLRRDLALKRFQGIDSPKKLFVVIADFHGVSLGPGIDAGLAVRSVSVEGRQGRVETASGQIFRFTRNDAGAWGSELALHALHQWPGLAQLDENLQRVERLSPSSGTP